MEAAEIIVLALIISAVFIFVKICGGESAAQEKYKKLPTLEEYIDKYQKFFTGGKIACYVCAIGKLVEGTLEDGNRKLPLIKCSGRDEYLYRLDRK